MSLGGGNSSDKRVGLIVGREQDWPDAFMRTINEAENEITVELIKLNGTLMDEPCPYAVIVDRMSHEIPYYRVYLQHAALQGKYIINNPFIWAADSKFLGVSLVDKLGFTSPRTIILPNKHVEKEMTPDSFRNLSYPMDWQGIIDYVGVPAIFKNISIGGRHAVFRVHNVDELIQRYDESGTLTMILQQIIESDVHIHCFVFGHETVMPLRYSLENGRYLPGILPTDDRLGRELVHQARTLTKTYGYDVNMVEFVLQDDQLYVINCTNPAPVMDRKLMLPEQFERCVNEIARVTIERASRPLLQWAIYNHS